MNSGMNCAEIHERVVLAVYSELPDDESHALLQHLAGCPPCREEQEQLQALKTLSAAYPVFEPSPNLVARSRTGWKTRSTLCRPSNGMTAWATG